MLARGTKIKRWNNFPRIEYVSFLDNIGFVIHIALFLAHLEEKNGVRVDTLYIIKKVMFESLKGLMLSDINAGTRDYITAINADMYKQVEKVALEKILSLPWIESIKQDISLTLWMEKEKENTIIRAARKYSAWKECSVNAKVYTETFEVPLHIIEKELHELSGILPSLKTLLESQDYQTYLSHIRRLSHSIRWSGENRLVPISVMSHLVIVAFISYCMFMIENLSWKKDWNLKTMLYTAFYHDIPEAITGDILSPIKNSVVWFPEVIEQAEEKMLHDYMFCHIEEDYKAFLTPLLFHPFDTEDGKIVKYADILSALYEAKIEVIFWNGRDYEEICHKMETKMMNIELKSVDYFLKNWLFEFNEKNIVQ